MKKILFLVIAMALVGCARSPQQISYQSATVDPAINPGDGIISRVTMVDGRNSTVIGTRGGAYKNTSVITLDVKALSRMRSYIQAQLLGTGFEFNTSGNNSVWEITMSRLSYDIKEVNAIKDKVEVSCELELLITLPDDTTYQNSYLSLVAEEVIGLPSDDKNAAIVNRAINGAIAELLADTAISEFYQ